MRTPTVSRAAPNHTTARTFRSFCSCMLHLGKRKQRTPPELEEVGADPEPPERQQGHRVRPVEQEAARVRGRPYPPEDVQRVDRHEPAGHGRQDLTAPLDA